MNNVKVYQADLNDSNSLDNVLNGCYGVFLVTDLKENNEKAQGIRAIDSALKNKFTNFVFSGLDHVEPAENKVIVINNLWLWSTIKNYKTLLLYYLLQIIISLRYSN